MSCGFCGKARRFLPPPLGARLAELEAKQAAKKAAKQPAAIAPVAKPKEP